MTILLAVLIMIDFMFLDDSHFIFDPSIQVRAFNPRRACFLPRNALPLPLPPSSSFSSELRAKDGTTTMNLTFKPPSAFRSLKPVELVIARLTA